VGGVGALPTFVRRGWTVCDVGASIGYYSLMLSRLVGPAGRAFAFEPDPALLPKLRRRLALEARNVELYRVALGAAAASRRFEPAPHREASGLPNLGQWSLVGEGLREGGFEVSFLTIEDFVAERGVDRLHFVEADIEGGELDLLPGARATVDSHRPLWMRSSAPPIATSWSASRRSDASLRAPATRSRASSRSRGRTSPARPARTATCRRSSM
jgi:FkbM family methyltransferase